MLVGDMNILIFHPHRFIFIIRCKVDAKSASHVWGYDHLSQGFGTFHWLVHNPLKVTATNYTTPKRTDAYPELDCALLHQKNIQGLHNHHLDDLNNMCVAHFSPEWPNASPLKIMRQTWSSQKSFIFHHYALLSSVFRLTHKLSFLLLWLPVCYRASLAWLHAGLSFSQAATSLSWRPISPTASS